MKPEHSVVPGQSMYRAYEKVSKSWILFGKRYCAEIKIIVYRVTKVTPKGFWIETQGEYKAGEDFTPGNFYAAHKDGWRSNRTRYVWATPGDALRSLVVRKEAHRRHIHVRLDKVEAALEAAKSACASHK